MWWYKFFDYLDTLPVEDNVNKILLALAVLFFLMALVEIMMYSCGKEGK